eukprot:4661837-Pleurochrysis_carterae.AAC.1
MEEAAVQTQQQLQQKMAKSLAGERFNEPAADAGARASRRGAEAPCFDVRGHIDDGAFRRTATDGAFR